MQNVNQKYIKNQKINRWVMSKYKFCQNVAQQRRTM